MRGWVWGVRMGAAVLALTAGVAAPQARDSYGSIAFSPSSGATGYSWGGASKGSAEKSAMKACRKQARDCRVGINFWNSCGAVALGSNGGWGSAWGETAELAQEIALGYCYDNDSNCRVIRWQCSFP